MKEWNEIKRYLEKLNLDPQKLACGCSVKIDLDSIVYPALKEIRPKLSQRGITLSSREDADISPLTGDLAIQRRVCSARENSDFKDLKSFNPDRAVSLTSVHRPNKPEQLSKRWIETYKELVSQGIELTVGKGHTIQAYSKDDEFVLFDFFKTDSAESVSEGYLVANNDTIQLIDPTINLGAEEQVACALSNTLNDLFTLGATEEIKILPVYAAPNDEISTKIEENIKDYCQNFEFTLLEAEPLPYQAPLLGATVFGQTEKEAPVFYEELAPGDLILVHRPFGDLAPINLYISSMIMGEEYLKDFGFTSAEVKEAKDERIKVMSKPNLDVGRLIKRYSPEYGKKFNPNRHVKTTGDLSGPGIDIFKELAQKAKVDIKLWDLPLANQGMVEAAAEDYLLPNGTSGTNGAIATVGNSKVIKEVAKELRDLGHDPQIIGEITGSGRGKLHLPPIAKDVISEWSPEKYEIQKKEVRNE